MRLAETHEDWVKIIESYSMRRAKYSRLISTKLIGFSGNLRCRRCGGSFEIDANPKCGCKNKKKDLTLVPDEDGLGFVWAEKEL